MQGASRKQRFSLRLCERKKCLTSLSEHDFEDLKDVQDGVVSCTSFHPQNRVQDEGKGVRGASRMRRFSLRLCELKKCLASSSEHDFKDLLDGQDGAASCPSFNL